MNKQITFIESYDDRPLRPEAGETVYLEERTVLWTTNTPAGHKRGQQDSSYTLKRTCPRTSPGGRELAEGWLGAYSDHDCQIDRHAHGQWKVTRVEDKPARGDEETARFTVHLRKVA